jgi:hypothetical protein
MNLIPWLLGAGLMVRLTVFPECTPTPEQLTGRATVLCLKYMEMINVVLKNYDL